MRSCQFLNVLYAKKKKKKCLKRGGWGGGCQLLQSKGPHLLFDMSVKTMNP